ncbi:hypothetical protein P691DRAFT_788303 [Macrolepiota fuliginosa MF-IS2]|uniref:Uncharacterized protein n=1 Tax=Macrolepiota fuliginosa MF-IS2 TaxID=1400762 RepID=A0A9P5X3A4_9AGAR|nr:hypothetical protein P691DRAFT_788303 [Macrolepiota fuliginosa MF-IS2]
MSSRPHNKCGNLIFASFCHPTDSLIQATDVWLVGELESTYISAQNWDALSSGEHKHEQLVISTPNADYLPQVNLSNQVISMCINGRWGAEDWSQWLQWFFDGQDHFVYILQKLKAKFLKSHPLQWLWWDMSLSDFIPSSNDDDEGHLSPIIANQLYEICNKLMEEVQSCRFLTTSFLTVMLTVAAAQQYCLETCALLDKLMKFDSVPIPQADNYLKANNEFMGCIADRLSLVYEFYKKGIPVWLVHPPAQVTMDTNIVKQLPVMKPAQAGICIKRWSGAPIFYQGPLSVEIHLSIYCWKPGQMDLTKLITTNEAESPSSTPPVPSHLSSLSSAAGPQCNQHTQPYSKSQAVDWVATKATHGVASAVCFQLLDSPYSSKSLDAWAIALEKQSHTAQRNTKLREVSKEIFTFQRPLKGECVLVNTWKTTDGAMAHKRKAGSDNTESLSIESTPLWTSMLVKMGLLPGSVPSSPGSEYHISVDSDEDANAIREFSEVEIERDILHIDLKMANQHIHQLLTALSQTIGVLRQVMDHLEVWGSD